VINLTNNPIRKKEIFVEAARYVYLMPGTPFDVDENSGDLKSVAASQSDCVPMPLPGGGNEDTTSVLKTIAAQLKTWYSKERQSMEITLNQPGHYVDLGTFITQINAIDSSEQVNTIVTSRETHLEGKKQRTILRTSYMELDYADMAGRPQDFHTVEEG
jgi:hypothetical protein